MACICNFIHREQGDDMFFNMSQEEIAFICRQLAVNKYKGTLYDGVNSVAEANQFLAPYKSTPECDLRTTSGDETHPIESEVSEYVRTPLLDTTLPNLLPQWRQYQPRKTGSKRPAGHHEGKGMVDSVFQASTGVGTHDVVLSSYEYVNKGL
ncbi:hypothetical protein QJS10_CPB19g00627 [Acorus calamus]|uniref:Uncharacterized protein n=1 Tax=Acorus calamus TaxID=4465 RepID=A0AAV9CH44_ACOCL|nr:hypothetical protein QJS10_CPB19g00627 [Acorus calamus]